MILRLIIWLRNLQPWAVFLLVWSLLFVYFGIYKNVGNEPLSVHQGAQSDRASVAYNFYKKSMDISKPRVMETVSRDGVCGMEFPAVNWLAAVLYKLFGYNPLWYRLLVYLLFSVGAYCAWLISAWFITKLWLRVLLLLLWNSSSILIFYSASFLPDVPALALTFVAWYWFFKHYFYGNKSAHLVWMLLFFALAGLVKATFASGILVVVGLYVIQWLFKRDFKLTDSKTLPLLMLPLVLIIAWIKYASMLTAKTSNMHFLQNTNMETSLSAFFSNLKLSFGHWHDSLYGPFATLILLGVLIYMVARQQSNANALHALLRSIAVLYGVAFLGFLVLFNKQFVYHDYYFITAVPFLFFAAMYGIATNFDGGFGIRLKGPAPIALLVISLGSVFFAKSQFQARLTPGNYFYQNVNATMDELMDVATKIKAIIPVQAPIIVANDPTPNTMLYALKRYGTRWPDWGKQRITTDLNTKQYQYIVVNDVKMFYQEAIALFPKMPTLVFHQGIWYVYKIKY